MISCYLHTASRDTRIALFQQEQLLAERRWPSERRESETLQPAVNALLREQGLSPAHIDRLIVCIGPGGFTSTRVGVSAANAWAFAKDLPVAAISLFDLYRDPEAILVISANPQEAWLQEPGRDPRWTDLDQLQLPESFVFTGVIDEAWRRALEDRGGQFRESEERLPDISTLSFEKGIIKPWYYKDPNITWSAKIRS